MALSHAKIFGTLAAHALGALPPREKGAAERHLASCPLCRAELTRLKKASSLLAPAPLAPPPSVKDGLMLALRRPPLELLLPGLPPRVLAPGALVDAGGQEAGLRAPGQAALSLAKGSLASLERTAKGLKFHLQRGAAMIQVATGNAFEARMPLGLVEVKGTYFYLESQGPRQSYLCLCEGWIGLSAPALATEIRTQDHQAFTLTLKNMKAGLAPANPAHPEPELPEI